MPSAGIVIMEAFLKPKPETQAEASINGYVIGRGGAHSIAIYERNGVSWVAEFRDGRGELMNANTWFYFHAERLGYWNRRQVDKSAQPLPRPMLEEIERLHREREAREAGTLTRRCKITLAGAAARLHRALETVAQADEGSCGREQSTAPTAVTALQLLNGLMTAMRSFLPGTRFGVMLIAFTITASLVGWLLVVGPPAQPSPLLPFFTT